VNCNCWVEINLDRIRDNIKQIKNILPKETKLLIVVKADGYGHGAIEVSKVAILSGANYLAVANCQEAIALREAKIITPILVLGIVFPQDILKVIKYGLTLAIYQLKTAQSLSYWAEKYNQKAKVHIKVDSGMGRLGILPHETLDFVKKLKELPFVEIEGIYTHLATADEEDDTYALGQFNKFKKILKTLEKEGISIPLKHILNSAGFLRFPSMCLDLVRIGIMAYGLYPSSYCREKISLKPAMCFKTRILQIKNLPKDSGISYGKTYITSQETKLAVLPVGYNDGYNRLLSDKGRVIIKDKILPLRGRICMDMCMVEISELKKVREGEEVILFGDNEFQSISVDEIAKICHSINYEIVCQVGKSVPRVHISSS